jgi:hypothetical protein
VTVIQVLTFLLMSLDCVLRVLGVCSLLLHALFELGDPEKELS